MKNRVSFFTILGVLTLGLFVLDLCSGSIWLNAFSLLGSENIDSMTYNILWNLRLPKAIVAILAGAALSVSGLMMQTMFRNPLAGAYTLGVSSGASLGVAFVTMCSTMFAWMPLYHLGSVFAAILGSTAVLLLVLAVSRHVRSNVSLVSLMQNFANPDALKLFIVWTLGSLDSVGWADMPIMLSIILLGLVLSFLLVKPLNGLMLGEDYARGLGINIYRTRIGIVLATGLLAGVTTAFCGLIAFVGVAVPHIARGLLQSSNHRLTMPACALIGAMLILICDIFSSLFVYPLPISTISALFGAPIIIYIIVKSK